MTNHTFALLIGVNDYSRFDPSGRSDLAGSVNDARRWHALCREHLRVPKAQVRVLASPRRDDPAPLPESTTPATLANITEGLSWLTAEMTRVRREGGQASGLITFSGHGTTVQHPENAELGLSAALCASDTHRDESGDLVGVITLAAIEALLAEVASDVTLAIDACYTSSSPLKSRSLPGLGPVEQLATTITSRLMQGCALWEECYEIHAGDAWHGAFTYSLLTLLEQWTTVDGDDVTYLNASYGDVVFRSHSLVDILGVHQTPTLSGPSQVSLVPVLRPGLAIEPNGTSPEPDVRHAGMQLSPGTSGYRIYDIKVSNTRGKQVTVAQVLAANNASPGYSPGGWQFTNGTEYWQPTPNLAATDIYDSDGNCGITGFEVELSQGDTQWDANDPPTGWDGSEQQDPVTPGTAGSCSWSSGKPPGVTPGQGQYSNQYHGASGDTALPTAMMASFSPVSTPLGSQTTTLEGIYWYSTSSNSGPWFDDETKAGDTDVMDTEGANGATGWWYGTA
ncbi:MAG: hypothetical protein AAF533_29730 [Acidobacteriota bacterium]